jgi:predicted PurR-regulated permease PerM
MIFIEYFKLNYIYIYYSIISNLTSIILWGFIELFAYDCINKLKNTKIYQYSFILWIISIILLILLLSLLLLLFIIKQYQIVSNNLNYIRNNIINYNNEIESENDSEYEFQ